ncbi:hypothetical protein YC2023_106583 [Brassica napus]
MVGKDTGRPRGFGFITFSYHRGADDAIKHMHRRELGDRVISVNKAEPKGGLDDVDHLHYRVGYPSRGKGSHGGGAAQDQAGLGIGQGKIGELERDRYMDRRRDGGRYSYIDRFESGDKYETDDLYPVESLGLRSLVSDRGMGYLNTIIILRIIIAREIEALTETHTQGVQVIGM